MSTHPYIPLYVDDYEAATAHLTLEEDGVYSRLMRLCWRTPGCSLPDDATWIARKIRLTADDFERIARPVLDEFFVRQRGRLLQRRLKAEYDEISRKKTARKNAGKKGGDAKALKSKENCPSNASNLPPHARAFPKPEPNPEPDILDAADDRASDVSCAPVAWPAPVPPDGAYVDNLGRVLRNAAGPCLNTASPKLFILAPILSLGKSGAGPPCDFTADVVPAVRACAAKAPPGTVNSWDYFVPAIREARDRRLRGAPAEGPVHELARTADARLAAREADRARSFAGAAAAAGQRWKP